MMAHEHASKYINANSKLFLIKKKIVDLQQFRALLVQLFAISVLWVHFKKADEFIMGNDAYNSLLNRIEFKLGVKSFCAAYGHEDLTEEQLDADFDTLDKDRSGNISFNEVKSLFSQITFIVFQIDFLSSSFKFIVFRSAVSVANSSTPIISPPCNLPRKTNSSLVKVRKLFLESKG
jgi:hypothetical protein